MNFIVLAFAALNVALVFACPRRWVLLPFLLGVSYTTMGQVVEVGPFSFTIVRILVLAGVVRVLLRGEMIAGGMRRLDWWLIVWGACAVVTSVFHNRPLGALIGALGLVYTWLGIYFMLRIFIRDIDDIYFVGRLLVFLLIPVASVMVAEKITGRNLFSLVGGGSGEVVIRHGEIRAAGPFAHPILAGTAGAATLPLFLLYWWRDRRMMMLGCAAAGAMILASTSSGPILTAAAVFWAMSLWLIRSKVRLMFWGGIVMLFVLDIIMNDPVYYLLARIDLTGSSTGWHRAALIHAAVTHLNEWWLYGTDYTRHWMPSGVPWSADHTDITNHYIKMGVYGGLPLMLVFMSVVGAGFAEVRRALLAFRDEEFQQQFLVWTLGSLLFAHAVTFLSVTYFDQTIAFFLFNLAAIAALRTEVVDVTEEEGPRVEEGGENELDSAYEPSFSHYR